MATVLIVDDHAVVRCGLRQFLADTEDLAITAEAASGQEAIALVQTGEWSLVLLDIALPDLSGLEVLKQIKRLRPNLPVLIFSMFSEDEFAMPSLEAGASGYLNKDSPPNQILTAIRTAVTGSRYVSPTLAEKLLAGVAPTGRKMAHEALSRREAEVLLMLSKGTSLTKIGEMLQVSVKTVSTYRTRIVEKLGLQSNAELTRYVIEHRLG
ncbi:MAG: response regulator transcription factor [Zoogloea oleivorans]|uniref:Response regulator transcription factor n=1 Tax=Zoogloea oleivorans TaxID=1552750 RepID=A0A6C2D0E1_9RHOO|nr:response regulator transcription factor [Zoogloea oleivorans]MBT9497426.1 response regulator transcription factor [Zoogloea sp.]MDY0036514.1 response regulator transcription factor [Zoogloea oleivorans]TYC59900.1 response regulator transcription factor [Zoogloea oleivorans]